MASKNQDPITGEPGAHPVGTGVGAAGGATAGAAIGAVAGPVGAAVGAAVGGVVGGLAGKGTAEAIDPTVEDRYWRDNHATRPYVEKDYTYDNDYAPAYRYGVESRGASAHKKWDEAEKDLAVGWERAKGKSRLEWEKARHATKDAWLKVEHGVGADRDRT